MKKLEVDPNSTDPTVRFKPSVSHQGKEKALPKV